MEALQNVSPFMQTVSILVMVVILFIVSYLWNYKVMRKPVDNRKMTHKILDLFLAKGLVTREQLSNLCGANQVDANLHSLRHEHEIKISVEAGIFKLEYIPQDLEIWVSGWLVSNFNNKKKRKTIWYYLDK